MRKNKSQRITKGKALIEARTALGPSTSVQMRGPDHCILDGTGNLVLYGRDWQEALKKLGR